MRAVNLIPVEERRGANGSGVGSLVLICVLALVVAVSATFALVNRSLAERKDKLHAAQAQAQAAETQAQQLAGYTSFAALREKRTDTVRSLAASRFDWSRSLHEVARTIPSNAWLTSLRGTVTPTVTIGGGASDPLRPSLNQPALELVGCTESQDDIAAVMSSLRRVDGVERVSLSSSEKLDNAVSGSATGDSGGAGDDCRQGNSHFPKFSLTLFFAAPAGTTTNGATP